MRGNASGLWKLLPKVVKHFALQWPRGRQRMISRPKWIRMPSGNRKFSLHCKVSVILVQSILGNSGFGQFSGPMTKDKFR